MAYRTWLDEDARDVAVLVASMDEGLVGDLVQLYHSSQMWCFLH